MKIFVRIRRPASHPALVLLRTSIAVAPARFVTTATSGHKVGWKLKQAVPGLETFVIQLFDASDALLVEKEVPAQSPQVGQLLQEDLELPLAPKAEYRALVSGYTKEGGLVRGTEGRIIIDHEAPQVDLFLGAEPVSNPCTNAPAKRRFVASRFTRFDVCARDEGFGNSGVAALCFKRADEAAPGFDDACWKSPSALLRSALLTSANGGVNSFTIYARDEAGNMGRQTQDITLSPGIPPRVDIVSPTSRDIAGTKWKAGEHKILRWKISDNDTLYEEIRILVTLMEASDQTRFRHLACNFTNSKVHSQCPDASLFRSPLIKVVDAATGEGTFDFTVPSDWDENKQYLLTVTAIDKAGNAAVASTQEINAPWEVLAGRTYKGAGGSGITVQATIQYPYLATNRLGELVSPHYNLKLNAFDNRTCRMLKPSNKGAMPFDCKDVITTDAPVRDARWFYDPRLDRFFTAVGKKIYTIDFQARSVTTMYESPVALENALAYDEARRQILFVTTEGRLMALAEDGSVRHILGNGEKVVDLDTQTKRQNEMAFPAGIQSLAVLPDGRVFLGADEASAWLKGGGFGRRYVATGISWTDPGNVASLRLMGNLESPTDRWSDLVYQSSTGKLFAAMAWKGIFELVPPAVNAPESDYEWKKSPMADNRLRYTHSIAAVPGTTLLYANDWWDYQIYQYDSSSRELDTLLGYPTGGEGAQLGQNRYIDTPRGVWALADTDVIFGDFYNLNRVRSSGGIWNVETAIAGFPGFAFKLAPNADTILQVGTQSIFTYSLSRKTREADIAWNQDEMGARGATMRYDLQQGIGNDPANPRFLAATSSWNGFQVHKVAYFKGSVNLTSQTPTYARLTALHALNFQEDASCGGICAQGPLLTASSGAKYIEASRFRLPQASGKLDWHRPVTTGAFDASDRFFYTCGPDTEADADTAPDFLAIDTQEGRVYPFRVTSPALFCAFQGAAFLFQNGKIFFAHRSGIYELDLGSVPISNTATARAVSTVGPMLPTTIHGFHMTPNYVYYGDGDNHRLLRNRR